mmetsp:Transcript_21682/g.52397  ORF Transcript_21682/g.52397 Transcript_21682/m.52397 type:complete len:256 (-) Transcript_21682:1239-2006(-)
MQKQKPPSKFSPVDLTITGRRCRIHRNDQVSRSLDEGTNLIELYPHPNTKSYTWNGEDDGSSNSADCTSPSTLRVDRHDARTLLDEMSLQQVCGRRSGDIDAGIDASSSEHASQPFYEEGSKEEVEAKNFERYGSLAEYSQLFLKSTTSCDPKLGEEKASCKKLFWGSDGHTNETQAEAESRSQDKEKDFELGEDQLKGMPSGILLVSFIRILRCGESPSFLLGRGISFTSISGVHTLITWLSESVMNGSVRVFR